MLEKRQYPRYRVSEDIGIEFDVQELPVDVRLMELGEGGCGFVADRDRLSLGNSVNVEFDWNTPGVGKVNLTGLVVYAVTSNHFVQDESKCYYGVQFLEDRPEQFASVIQKLEDVLSNKPL